MTETKYAVVFDLDETLGAFSQPYRFWYYLKKYLRNDELEDKYFFKFLDLFPEFIRTNIFSLLKNLREKKKNRLCNNVMIYTNNNGPTFWVDLIKSYFNKKLKYPLFDQIIRAYKIGKERIELCRNSDVKSYRDFVTCTKLPSDTKLIFIDDKLHEGMIHKNVRYIHIKPYHYTVDYSILAQKFYNANKKLFTDDRSIKDFIHFFNVNTSYEKLEHSNKSKIEKNIDHIFAKQTEKVIEEFFSKSKRCFPTSNRNTTRKSTRPTTRKTTRTRVSI